MKLLFNKFNEYDVRYNYLNDFNKDEEFHGVTLKMWEKGEKADPLFGMNQYPAHFDYDADIKLREALKNDKYNHSNQSQTNDSTECLWCWSFSVGIKS